MPPTVLESDRMESKQQSSPGRDGCGFLVLTCVGICLLLAINGVLVALFYAWLLRMNPAWSDRPRLSQTLHFVGPVLLVFLEWWLIDVCTGTGKQPKHDDYYLRKAILGPDARGGAMGLLAAWEMTARQSD